MTESLPAKAPEKKPTFKFGMLRKYEPESKPIVEEPLPKNVKSEEKRGEDPRKGSVELKPPAKSRHGSIELEVQGVAPKGPRGSMREETKQQDDPKPFHLPPLALPRTKLQDGPKPASTSTTQPNKQTPSRILEDDVDDSSVCVEIDPVDEEAAFDKRMRQNIDAAFSVVRVPLLLIIFVFLSCLRTILSGIISPLIFGLVALVGNHLLAPGLRVLRKSIIAPVAGFVRDLSAFARDACDPLWQGLGNMFRSIALMIGSFRLVEINLYERQRVSDALSYKRSEPEQNSGRPHNI